MEVRLPKDKLHRICCQVKAWLTKKKATKRQILSQVGQLQHATKIVCPGHTFLSRMYNTAAKLKQPFHRKKLSAAFCSDLHWWHVFVMYWNGVSFLHLSSINSASDCCIKTDASGSWGCAAWFAGIWFQYKWPGNWISVTIMTKELVPILFSCVVWGPALSRRNIEFKCDSFALVQAINKGSSKDSMVMHLLRSLWFFTAYFDISIRATHLPGVLNTSADMWLRNQLHSFFQFNPDASRIPTLDPRSLLQLISPCQLGSDFYNVH